MQPAPGHPSGPPVAIFTQTLALRLITAVFVAPCGIWLAFFTDHGGNDIGGFDILLALGLFLLGLTAKCKTLHRRRSAVPNSQRSLRSRLHSAARGVRGAQPEEFTGMLARGGAPLQ